jgi:hypothetical protein
LSIQSIKDRIPNKVLANGAIRYGVYDENDNLVRHYIPCYSKNNEVPGLYDVVNNEFYTNGGTDNFEMGPEI